MDQLVQCPVCTLYLHEGMSLGAHLDTHPKDQVIQALCSFAKGGKTPSHYGSRSSTPYDCGQSERSYRSRSRTPAPYDGRHHRRRHAPSTRPLSPYRNNKSDSSQEGCSSKTFRGRLSVDPTRLVSTPLQSECSFPDKSEPPSTAASTESLISDQIYLISPNPTLENSVPPRTFSRHGEFVFHKQPMSTESVTVATFVQPKLTITPSGCSFANKSLPLKEQDGGLEITTNDNITVLKTNGPPGLQYVTPGVKPVHFVVPVSQSFMQTPQKNILISTSLQRPASESNKSLIGQVFPNRFTPIASPTFQQTPTCLTPKPQFIYQEHDIGGKKFLSTLPILNQQDDPSKPSQPGPVYQKVMVFNPYSNTSCMYPQAAVNNLENQNQCFTDNVNNSGQSSNNTFTNKIPTNVENILSKACSSVQNAEVETSKTHHGEVALSDNATEKLQLEEGIPMLEIIPDQGDNTNVSENTSKSSGVKILSNIKVEFPMPNNNLLPEIIDLTLAQELHRKNKADPDIAEPNLNEDEAILPDFVDEEMSNSYSHSRFSPNRENYSNSQSLLSASPVDTIENEEHIIPVDIITSNSSLQAGTIVNTFSVIKNIGNPNLYKDNPPSSSQTVDEAKNPDQKNILSDLMCKEKPSISPCSDLTNDSHEGAYDRINNLPEPTNSLPKPPAPILLQSRFPLSTAVTRNVTKKNVFTGKPRKVLYIKNPKMEVKAIDAPSSSKKNEKSPVNNEEDISKNDKGIESALAGVSRLDGFFKVLEERLKIDSELTVVPSNLPEKQLQIECRSFANSPKDDSTSFDADTKEQSMDIEPECSMRSFNNEFHPRHSDKDTSKASCSETISSADRLAESTQKSFAELETMRPVNVIAFGNMHLPTSASNNSNTSTYIDSSQKLMFESESLLKDKHSLVNLIQESYMNEYFNAEKEFVVTGDNVVQKMELCATDEEIQKDTEYIWDSNPQKEEFAFSNFMQINYGQGTILYPRIEDCKEAKGSTDQGPAFSADDMCNDGNDYAELICPRDSFLEQDHKGSFLEAMGSERGQGLAGEVTALNIRTDERMPPRGELSEQESSGDVDTPWAGMYRDVVGGSTSYDLLARETWVASDGSDVDMPPSPITHSFNEAEDMPIVVAVKPPDRNYKCATCGKCFNCPKERRVHRTKEHPIAAPAPTPTQPKKPIIKRRKQPQMIKTHIKIKNEKITNNEPIPLTHTNIRIIDRSGLGDASILNVKLDGELPEDLESLDKKPKLEIVKVEKKRRDYSCMTCKEEFISDNSFNEHLKIHPLECLTCGKFFNRRANLQLHIKRHLGIKNFRCDICEKRFITKQKMIEHYNVHTGNSPIKCSLCDETFRRHSNMVQHRNRHHFQLKRRLRDYVCHCGEVFHSKKKLAWHKEIHDDRPKACLHCSEKFIHMASLTRHMRRAHNKFYVPDERRQRENVQCPICSHVYLKSSIDMHLRTHTGKKPFSCVICNKNFTTKWNLKLHRWTHANRSSKPFKCALCKGAFIRHADYISHMNAHKSVRPYTCNYCGCQFIRKYNCQRHVKEHENDKKYVCQIPDCGKTFHRSYYLSEHMRVHSGARPFSCNICGKTSSTKSNHNKHVKIHHAREPVTTEAMFQTPDHQQTVALRLDHNVS